MRKAIKGTALYSFLLPIILELVGVMIDPSRTKYIVRYPFSYFFEQLLNGALSIIPSIVLLLFAYNNLFKKQPGDKYYKAHKMATVITMCYILLSTTIFNSLIFLFTYLHLKGKIWTVVAGYGIFPVNAIILVLVVYGLGFIIGRLSRSK